MAKKKSISVNPCAYCGTEIHGDGLKTFDYPNEGCSEIVFNGKSFQVDIANYCDLECFFKHVRFVLNGECT